MQRPIRRVCILALLLLLAGCAGASPEQPKGTVTLGLQLSPGTSVSTATYTIDGPNGFASAGSVPIGDSADVSVVVSHLPIADGYQMDVSATASDGVTVCEGSTAFDVKDSSSTVVVHLVCAVPSGDVNVLGTVNICPVIDGLSASPNSLNAGGIAQVTAEAHDADHGPSPLSYAWTINGAKLPRQIGPALAFTCSSAGDVTIAATVSDGDPNPSCADTLSVKVSCAAP